MARPRLDTLAGDLFAVALVAATLSLACQGDCNRTGDEAGDADDGMEPADTCKPGDQSCHADPPAPAVTTEPDWRDEARK